MALDLGVILDLVDLVAGPLYRRWKKGPGKLDRLFEHACAATGQEQQMLLASFCEKCARKIQKNPEDSHTLHRWGLALWWRAAKAPRAEADRLYEQADKKFAQAQAIAPGDGEIRANRADALWRRAALHPDEEGRRILIEVCGQCERRVGIYGNGPHDARIFQIWGLAIRGLAQRESGSEADRLYQAADEKFIRGSALAPGQTEMAVNRAETMLWRATLHTGTARREILARVVEQCAAEASAGAGGAPVLATWGYALCWKAADCTGTEADQLYQEAQQKFARALTVDPQNKEAAVGRMRAWLGRALLERGAARRMLLEEVCRECSRLGQAEPQDLFVLELWGKALLWRAVMANGPDAERLLMEASGKFSAGLSTKPADETFSTGLALTLSFRSTLADEVTARQFNTRAGELLEAVVSKNPGNQDAAAHWAEVLSLRVRLSPGEETNRMLANAAQHFAAASQQDPGSAAALRGWGMILWAQSRCLTGERSAQLFREAKAKLLEAEARGPGSAAYCLAGICAQAGELDESRRWLEASGEPGTTVGTDTVRVEPAFAKVRDLDWFQRLLARQEEQPRAELFAAFGLRSGGTSSSAGR